MLSTGLHFASESTDEAFARMVTHPMMPSITHGYSTPGRRRVLARQSGGPSEVAGIDC